MPNQPKEDWNPQQGDTLQNQRPAYDHMREHCPVAYSHYFQWSLFRHQDVSRVLQDHASFSSRVSNNVSVPNGMDLPEHSAYRALIDPYFSPGRMAAFKPQCQAIAAELTEPLATQIRPFDIMTSVGVPFALRIQCAFMGWPASLQDRLQDWTQRNNRAVRERDRSALKDYADEFEALIKEQLDARRTDQQQDEPDLTAQLMQEQVNGQRLDDRQIASILRNWTVGEVGTIAASIGIIMHHLACHPDLQQQLREKPEGLWYANDEILRLHNPLTDNRRRTTCPVDINGRPIPAEQRITINWVAANRDPAVFEQADQFRWDRDPTKNLLYGAGIHVCPGAPLARMELVIIIRSILQNTGLLTLATDPIPASYPMSGYAKVLIQTAARTSLAR